MQKPPLSGAREKRGKGDSMMWFAEEKQKKLGGKKSRGRLGQRRALTFLLDRKCYQHPEKGALFQTD